MCSEKVSSERWQCVARQRCARALFVRRNELPVPLRHGRANFSSFASRAPRARRSRAQPSSRSVRAAARAPSLFAHSAPPSHTESNESAQVLSSTVPLGHSCISVNVGVARVPFRSRAAADQFASLISTPCASLPRDCPILRFRAGLCLSQGPVRLSVRDELWSDMPHALHLIPSELAATLWSHISMLPNAHACILSFSSSLCGSQDDRDAHQVCSGEDQRPQKGSLLGRLFPGRDQDCLWFMGQDDQSLGFGCAFAITSRLLGQN